MRGSTRRELVAAISGRYQTAARGEKQKILDEFVAVTNYHRSMERHGHLRLDAPVRERLLTASAATIDRLLTLVRAEARGGARRRPRRSIRRTVPVRTFADWNDPLPGYIEGDLVAHCGESAAGSFVQTLVLTDIASGLDRVCGAYRARADAESGGTLKSASRFAVPAARTRHRQRQCFHE